MNITSAQYRYNPVDEANDAVIAVIDGKSMSVPLDPANRHYQAIQEWVAEGNTIQDAD